MESRARAPAGMDGFHRKRSEARRYGLRSVSAGLLLLAASMLVSPDAAMAHPLAPSLLELRERGDGLVDVHFKTPLLQARGAAHAPRLPEACQPVGVASEAREGTGVVIDYVVDCGEGGLTGRSIGLDGLESGVANALVRVVSSEGEVRQALLSARDPVFVVPERPGLGAVARSYTALGIEHLVFGFDHVLFVVGLLMLIRGRRLLLLTITSFTVGHSVTLALAVLGFVRFPTALVEVGIAGSLLLLAMEIPAASVAEDGHEPGLFERSPWAIAFAFGLLHGLGFAGALAEIGLPAEDVPLALLAFNVGIELGQLALVGVVFGFLYGAAQLRVPVKSPMLRAAAIAGIGMLAGYWVIERVFGYIIRV